MKVLIKKANKSFKLICPYNTKIHKITQKINKRFWDRDKKIWILPIDSLKSLKDEISKHEDIEIVESLEHVPIMIKQ